MAAVLRTWAWPLPCASGACARTAGLNSYVCCWGTAGECMKSAWTSAPEATLIARASRGVRKPDRAKGVLGLRNQYPRALKSCLSRRMRAGSQVEYLRRER
ncbi:hypothetical protein [Lysobacter gummosus]|uniref:hypothetical protein n=1 Tax=Lysobacter gummosus TaxID=262324 RepID=UPI003631A64F